MWMTTYTGKKFDIIKPKAEMVCIEDIAHSLANQCRFNGHVNNFYSVAQHSVCVARHLEDRQDRLHGLLHDSPETYLGDIITPIKQLISDTGCEALRRLEASVIAAIRIHFGLEVPSWPVRAQIKEADTAWLYAEGEALFDAIEMNRPKPSHITLEAPEPLGPIDAEKLFLSEFERINNM